MGNSGTGILVSLSFLFFIIISGCTGGDDQWSMTLNGDGNRTIDASLYDELKNCSITVNGVSGIPLEFFLYDYGLFPVDAVSVDGRTYNWTEVTYGAGMDVPFLVLPNGSIYDGQSIASAKRIEVTLAERPGHTTLEIAPSILYAMGLGGEEGLIGQNASRVVVFYVDGMGYERYTRASALGLIENISALGEPVKALCEYPSISQVNARALVTGMPSDIRAGSFRNAYPSGKTVLEAVSETGATARWVAGLSSPVNLGDQVVNARNYDSNGYEADEVASEAIQQCYDGVSLLFVHFKDTDKKMHLSGPYSGEGMASMEYVDEQLGRVVSVLGPGTVVIVYSDHGGHTTIAGGNHGTLVAEDMVVPIIVHVVDGGL
jgi:hypothetical protein